MNKKLLIFGLGEVAELTYHYFTNDSDWDVAGFICDDQYHEKSEFLGLPCIALSEITQYPPEAFAVHIALSYRGLNKSRKEKYLELKHAGYETPSYISSKATLLSHKIGENCLILEDQTIQPNVTIGNNVVLWSGNHIGHGTKIDDHVYVASHAVISGNCHIKSRTFIGVNAAIKDFTCIEEECFIGMGVNITKNCRKGTVVLPEKPNILEQDNPLAEKIKKSYFGDF